MATHLSVDAHLDAIVRGGGMLRDAAAEAGLEAMVPTCPEWDVRELVSHQGMVHRWAAAHLRGDGTHEVEQSLAAAGDAPDLLAWFDDGLDALVETVSATSDDVSAPVFLKDPPASPRAFWARRQAHETTIHGVDAVSAVLGGWPSAADVSIEPGLAADGIDELLCGFITRGSGRVPAPEPITLLVTAEDTGHAWSVRISDGPIKTTAVGAGGTTEAGTAEAAVGTTETTIGTPGATISAAGAADATLSGTAVQLYLWLWNRSDELTVRGREGVLALWREHVRVNWG